MPMWQAGAFAITRRIVSGCTRGFLSPKKRCDCSLCEFSPPMPVPTMQAVRSPQPVAAEIQSRLRDGLARRDERKLRDAIEQRQALVLEVRGRIEAAHFRGDLDVEQVGRDIGDRADARAALAHRRPSSAAALWPSAEIAPMPVMTTRRWPFMTGIP